MGKRKKYNVAPVDTWDGWPDREWFESAAKINAWFFEYMENRKNENT